VRHVGLTGVEDAIDLGRVVVSAAGTTANGICSSCGVAHHVLRLRRCGAISVFGIGGLSIGRHWSLATISVAAQHPVLTQSSTAFHERQ
jgi:hypothetical protein